MSALERFPRRNRRSPDGRPRHAARDQVTPTARQTFGNKGAGQLPKRSGKAPFTLSGRDLSTLRQRYRWYRQGRRWPSIVILILVLGGIGGAIAYRVTRPPAAAVVDTTEQVHAQVPGVAPSLPWPANGEAAVSVPAVGLDVQSADEAPVPIASLTKVMAAYLILRDHPVPPLQSGPTLTMSTADQEDYQADLSQGIASMSITTGQQFTELALLQGTLIRSASDYIDALARWDSGTTDAFIAKMNATAASLGMHSTHYADIGGVDPASVSTANDQLIIANQAMRSPVFRAIVSMPSITLPGAGVLNSFTPLIGTNNVVGIKSGYTAEAASCDMLAFSKRVAGISVSGQPAGRHTVFVLAVVTGQTASQAASATVALQLASTAAGSLHPIAVIHSGQKLGQVSIGHYRTAAVATGSVSVLGWPMEAVSAKVVGVRTVRAGDPQGKLVADGVVQLGTQRVVVPERLATSLPRQSVIQRIL